MTDDLEPRIMAIETRLKLLPPAVMPEKSRFEFCNNPKKKMDILKKELVIRSIKITNMVYATFIFGVVALVLVILLDKYVYPKITFDKSKEDKDKSQAVLGAEVLFFISLNGILGYILRNVLQYIIPFPFNKVCGFDPMRVMEIRSGALIGMILLFFSKTIRTKMYLLQSKF